MKFFFLMILLTAPNLWAQVSSPVTQGEEVKAAPTKTYSKLYLLLELNLLNFTWEDLSLKEAQSFSDPIMNTWLKWFASHELKNISEVVLCNGACLKEFGDWEQIELTPDKAVPESLKNSLWLKVSFNLRKNQRSELVNEAGFEWEGSAVLLDSNTKKVLGSERLWPEVRTIKGSEAKSINSALASFLYRAPLDSFQKLLKKTENTQSVTRLERLVIQNFKNLTDVLSLIEILRKEGKGFSLEPALDTFNSKEAKILCYYQGEEKSFTDLLSRLKELKSPYKLVTEPNGTDFVVRFVSE